MLNFQANLVKFLKQAKLTQGELALLVGVSQPRIQQLETNPKSSPSLELLDNIFTVLSGELAIDMEQLLYSR